MTVTFLSSRTMLLLSAAVATMALSSNAFSINSHLIRHASTRPSLTTHQPISPTVPRHMSTWDDFCFDDDDELLDSGVDADFVAADENDDPEVKAAAGASLEAPEVRGGLVGSFSVGVPELSFVTN